MTRVLAENCTPPVVSYKDNGKAAAERASDAIVMGAVWSSYVFSLLVSQQTHSDLSFKALDDAIMEFNQRKGNF
jgi:hypothetical protein